MPTAATIAGGSWQYYNNADGEAASVVNGLITPPAYVNASGIDVYNTNPAGQATHNYNTGTVTGELINTQIYNRKIPANFWSNGFKGAGVKVAILDTGCKVTNTINVAQRVNVWNAADTVAADTHGHGTRAASCIAELPNGHPLLGGSAKPNGIVGIAHECSLHVVQILSATSGTQLYPQYNTGLAKGLHWCLDNNIEVVITSSAWASDTATRSLLEQLVRKGVWVVCSAGNTQMNQPPASILYPAAYPGVFCIGAKEGGHVFVESTDTAYNNINAVGNKYIDYVVEPYFVSQSLTGYSADIGTSQASWIFGSYLVLIRQLLNRRKLQWSYNDVVAYLSKYTAVTPSGYRYITNFDFVKELI